MQFLLPNLFLIICYFILVTVPSLGQDYSSLLDTTLNNLIHPQGYLTCKIGDLGKVKISGSGDKSMILIPGIGFGGDVLSEFAAKYEKEYTIYSITPAGFEDTPAPEMPETSVKYNEFTWTKGIVEGILKLIAEYKIEKPVIVGHFITATQAALTLAMKYPDKISKVIIISGSPYRYYAEKIDSLWQDWSVEKKITLQQRSKITETWWAPKWFKFVTKKTWDDNMWTPADYCSDSIKGNLLFKKSAEVPLPVMVRYMIEWGDYDPSENYAEIHVPLLILIPDFIGIFKPSINPAKECEIPANKQYLKYYHQQAWMPAEKSGNPLIKVKTISNSRIFMWIDNPEDTYNEIDDFLK